MTENILKIAIADDHTLFRENLALWINASEELEVVIEASNGKDLLDKLEYTKVDILLLDIQMPVMDGFEAAKIIKRKYRKVKILILTLMDDISMISKVIEMDLHGVFTKNTSPKELKKAILGLKEDGFYSEKSLYSQIHKVKSNTAFVLLGSEHPNFTESELNIIEYFAQGLRAKEIADILNISSRTVEVHKQNILRKSDFDSMITVIAYCYHHKIIKTEDILSKVNKH
ncbi:MAG: response regulator transcription factor [Myroides sp.]|nr:response regulator transcription factor [Myroides sp.]